MIHCYEQFSHCSIVMDGSIVMTGNMMYTLIETVNLDGFLGNI